MKQDEFLGRVQSRGGLPSRDAAERATWATLRTLAEYYPDGQAKHIAAHLSLDIRGHLSPDREPLPPHVLDDFFRRVSERAGAPLCEAAYHARAVIEVLGQAVVEHLCDGPDAARAGIGGTGLCRVVVNPDGLPPDWRN